MAKVTQLRKSRSQAGGQWSASQQTPALRAMSSLETSSGISKAAQLRYNWASGSRQASSRYRSLASSSLSGLHHTEEAPGKKKARGSQPHPSKAGSQAGTKWFQSPCWILEEKTGTSIKRDPQKGVPGGWQQGWIDGENYFGRQWGLLKWGQAVEDFECVELEG